MDCCLIQQKRKEKNNKIEQEHKLKPRNPSIPATAPADDTLLFTRAANKIIFNLNCKCNLYNMHVYILYFVCSNCFTFCPGFVRLLMTT